MSNPLRSLFPLTLDKAVRIPMRDGTLLAADIYRPAVEGKFPALVERTPYNREQSVILRTQTPQFMAERGYVFVVQDVRGRFGSDGLWYPFVDDGWGENRDGYDTIEWIAQQPWCNGRVGTAGGSYAGQTQMLLAPTRPPSLGCCFVREAASDLTQQWIYRGGALELAFNYDWMMRHGGIDMRRQGELINRAIGVDQKRFEGLPLGKGPLVRNAFQWLHDVLDRAECPEFWDDFNFEKQYGRIDTPMYHMAGWFDIFLAGSLRNFVGIAEEGRSKATRKSQKLLIGPWTHGPTVHDPAFARYVGDMDFGPQAVFDFNGEMLRWYDHWLKGEDTGVLEEPRIRYFLMGANEWRTATSWPPPDTAVQRWYLHAGRSGSAESLNDGLLSTQTPGKKEEPDSYRYDPADPAPTVGGNTLYSIQRRHESGEETPDFSITAGPRDQRPVEPRCLTYTSGPLTESIDVVGPVTAILYVSSSCVDTDFAARLCDVFPDGRSILVVDGILRARYRKSIFRPKLMRPGKVYRLEIDLWPTAWRFAEGHRLRLAIASSNFPRFDRNLNNGKSASAASEMEIAVNTVHHERAHPSCIALPCLPRL